MSLHLAALLIPLSMRANAVQLLNGYSMQLTSLYSAVMAQTRPSPTLVAQRLPVLAQVWCDSASELIPQSVYNQYIPTFQSFNAFD